MAYYDELARASDTARRVGWESVAMQHRRFAAVAARLGRDESVLDLGAGLGDFGRYLAAHGHRGAYLGIERDASLLAAGLVMEPRVALHAGDLFACELRADVVVAIGALVDGRGLRSDGVRFGRLRQMFAAVARAAARVGVVIVAKQEAIEARPVLAADEALGGMRASELAWLAPTGELVDATEVDWLVVLPATNPTKPA